MSAPALLLASSPALPLGVALVGACAGSFLNVVAWRLPREESIVLPPSHCPHCGTRLRWFDNIPLLSWLLLRGRCGHCNAPIALRYPLVELLCAAPPILPQLIIPALRVLMSVIWTHEPVALTICPFPISIPTW